MVKTDFQMAIDVMSVVCSSKSMGENMWSLPAYKMENAKMS